ncbi:MAG: MBL fold metallo-hydrolase [Actinobacteria bacterium]|nr:MBL fold metallo-hydrolase [Actinomycetota bacterium]
MTVEELTPTADVHVLVDGYARDRGAYVASTCTLISDGDTRIVADPGLVADRQQILGPLEELGIDPADVTDVTLSHHHPDHTVNVALFPHARVHDHWAVYEGDRWDSRPAEGVTLAPSVMLLETPGHTPQDMSVVASTPDGLTVLTHSWWYEAGPPEDPFGDQAQLEASRERILSLPGLVRIIPGHGPPFAPPS